MVARRVIGIVVRTSMEIENAALVLQPDARVLAEQFGFLDKYDYIIQKTFQGKITVFWMYVGSGSYDRMYWRDGDSYLAKAQQKINEHPFPVALPTYRNRKKYISISIGPSISPATIAEMKKLKIDIYQDLGQDGALVFSFF